MMRLIWVDIFYNLFLLLGTTLAVATQSVHNYRLVILTFIGGSLSLLFVCIDVSINVRSDWNNAAAKYSAAGAGLIFQSLVLIFWVIYFGAEDDSLAKRTIHGFTIPRTSVSHQVVSPQQQHQQALGSPQPDGQNLSSVVVTPAQVYAYKARALYSYDASPEDRNELSFAKGEILDIVDNQGKWWQARKQDGSIGIAPSNYLQLI
ncbi:Transmembrane osmosensor [Mortierella claussenii]|nr:Transmembrane osmosensor [Mortierella claussenii]